jgi:hypothetical protein
MSGGHPRTAIAQTIGGWSSIVIKRKRISWVIVARSGERIAGGSSPALSIILISRGFDPVVHRIETLV